MSLLFAPAGVFEKSLSKRCLPDKWQGNGWKSCTPLDWSEHLSSGFLSPGTWVGDCFTGFYIPSDYRADAASD